MNRKILWIVLGTVIVGTGAFLAYRFFGGSNKHLILVPANATFVVRFDVKSLVDKISENGEIKKTKIYKKLEKESLNKSDDPTSKVIAQILKNPTSTGINVFSDAYYYMYNTKNVTYNALVLDIKDIEDFNKTVLKFPEAKTGLKKGKEFNYIKLSSRSIVAWNTSGLLWLNKEYSWFYDESPNETIEKTIKGFMKMKKESSIMSDKDFMEYDKTDDDVALYISYDKVFRLTSLQDENNEGVENIKKVMKGVKLGVGLSFETDVILTKMKIFGDTKEFDKMNYIGTSGLTEKTMNAICADKLLGLISMNIDYEKLIAFAGEITGEERSLRREIEETAGEFGLTSKQLIGAFGKELSLALLDFESRTYNTMDYSWNDITMTYEMMTVIKTKVLPIMTLAVSVNDKKVISQILSNNQFEVMPDGRQKLNLPFYDSMSLYVVLKDKLMFMSNSDELSAKMQKDGKIGELQNAELKGLVKENPANFYLSLDAKKYTALTTSLAGNSGRQFLTYFESYMAMFKDINYTGNGHDYEQRINLKKGTGNSLYRLVKQMDELPVETW
jgi:hypothetical protein